MLLHVGPLPIPGENPNTSLFNHRPLWSVWRTSNMTSFLMLSVTSSLLPQVRTFGSIHSWNTRDSSEKIQCPEEWNLSFFKKTNKQTYLHIWNLWSYMWDSKASWTITAAIFDTARHHFIYINARYKKTLKVITSHHAVKMWHASLSLYHQ